MKFLFVIILQVLMNPVTNDVMYQEPNISMVNEYNINNNISLQTATDMEWVWCDVCHQHLPEMGGKLYNWDNVNHIPIGLHEHQNGYTDDLPIDSNGNGIYFMILLCAILCFYNIVYGKDKSNDFEKY